MSGLSQNIVLNSAKARDASLQKVPVNYVRNTGNVLMTSRGHNRVTHARENVTFVEVMIMIGSFFGRLYWCMKGVAEKPTRDV